MKQLTSKRKRGITLTFEGIKRFQEAIVLLEKAENNGKHFTMKELSIRMRVSTKTLSRLYSISTLVDMKTVRLCFNVLNLDLSSKDYEDHI